MAVKGNLWRYMITSNLLNSTDIRQANWVSPEQTSLDIQPFMCTINCIGWAKIHTNNIGSACMYNNDSSKTSMWQHTTLVKKSSLIPSHSHIHPNSNPNQIFLHSCKVKSWSCMGNKARIKVHWTKCESIPSSTLLKASGNRSYKPSAI